MNPHDQIGPIRYLRRKEIDIDRWNARMESAWNSLIYGRSFYLDAMAGGQWDALVLEDYEAIMPLTWRSKAGIRYLYQPAFTQQTGIFTPQPISPELLQSFLHQAQRHFRFAEVFLNYGNEHPSLERHANFILHLDQPYDRLAKHYKPDLAKNLKRAALFSLQYTAQTTLSAALAAYRSSYAHRTPHVRDLDYDHFARICTFLQQNGQLLLREVADPRGQWLAAAILLRNHNRLTLLQSTTPQAGRDMHANHYLLDRLIHEWAGTGCILDFEGSDIPGIAHFYKNFGSIDQPYYFYRYNRLPWPVSLLKGGRTKNAK